MNLSSCERNYLKSPSVLFLLADKNANRLPHHLVLVNKSLFSYHTVLPVKNALNENYEKKLFNKDNSTMYHKIEDVHSHTGKRTT